MTHCKNTVSECLLLTNELHVHCFNSLFDLIPMVVCLQNTLSIEQLGISISKFIALSASSLMHPIYSYCMWANRITWKVGRHIVREWSPPSAFNPSVLVPGTQLNEYAAVSRVVSILFQFRKSLLRSLQMCPWSQGLECRAYGLLPYNHNSHWTSGGNP